MISHHPTEATLGAYAGGALPEALGVVIATHVRDCPVCRALQALVEDIGGAELDDMPPTALDNDALALVLARAERPAVAQRRVIPTPGLPPPLDACAFGPWQRIGFGLRWRPMSAGGGIVAGLLEAMPGKVLPTHSHTGLELTCVITGSFVVDGVRFSPGDLAEVEGAHRHRPRIDSDVPCLCVIATEGVRFLGLLGLAQRLLSDR